MSTVNKSLYYGYKFGMYVRSITQPNVQNIVAKKTLGRKSYKSKWTAKDTVVFATADGNTHNS